ncbi:uncharacterized protein [Montipora foliosa]|uniref:uncharacterized protein n=1 Tax=Montipora foliosa TaxID=591990 RepID=UPI0035F14208
MNLHDGWSYLRLMISMCHSKLNSIKYAIREIQHEILGLIPSTEFATLMVVILHRNHREENKTRARHEQKLKRGDPTFNDNRREEIKKRWVVNASDCDLEANEISLLRKGMNFAITPRSVPVKEVLTAVEQGISNLPRDAKDEVRGDICNIIKNAKAPKTYNLNQGERQAMKKLKGNDSILVLPADKGNATVVMNKLDYKEQISSMLQDTKTYLPVTDKRRNPVSSTTNLLQRKFGELKKSGNLTEKEYFKMKPSDLVPAAFYGLPKVHKVQLTVKDDHYTLASPSTPIPLKPINSSIGSPTYHVSKPRQSEVRPDEEIISFDVVFLFTSIPVDLALKVIQRKLESNHSWKDKKKLTKNQIVELTKIVLHNSFFSYEGILYHQITGCAMGSPVSVVIADLVMEQVNFAGQISSLRLYADDTTTYASDLPNSPVVLQHLLNQDMKRLSSWLVLNYLQVNGEKTQAMILGNLSYRYDLEFAGTSID